MIFEPPRSILDLGAPRTAGLATKLRQQEGAIETINITELSFIAISFRDLSLPRHNHCRWGRTEKNWQKLQDYVSRTNQSMYTREVQILPARGPGYEKSPRCFADRSRAR